jgi:hypothetical protein
MLQALLSPNPVIMGEPESNSSHFSEANSKNPKVPTGLNKYQ